MFRLLPFYLLLLLLAGCSWMRTDAEQAAWDALGSEHLIEFYQGGEVTRFWTSTGKPVTGEAGTRYAFKDKATGAYVRIGVANTVVTEIMEGTHE